SARKSAKAALRNLLQSSLLWANCAAQLSRIFLATGCSGSHGPAIVHLPGCTRSQNGPQSWRATHAREGGGRLFVGITVNRSVIGWFLHHGISSRNGTPGHESHGRGIPMEANMRRRTLILAA